MTIEKIVRRFRRAVASSLRVRPKTEPVVETTWPTGEKLNLGCGPKVLPGWTNVDISAADGVIQHDLRKQFPLPAETFRFIYSEHFIEHISRDEALALLKECYRLLRAGGVIRLSTPSLAKLVEEYLAGRLGEWSDVDWHPRTPCQLLNEGLRLWEHQFVYDLNELTLLLREAGWQEITAVGWQQSEHPELQGLETRPFHGEIIVEATK